MYAWDKFSPRICTDCQWGSNTPRDLGDENAGKPSPADNKSPITDCQSRFLRRLQQSRRPYRMPILSAITLLIATRHKGYLHLPFLDFLMHTTGQV